jgi:phosphoribosylanthranilate isomerase
MNYITTVKAGNITNLSNARYCAGMGTDIIGFPIGKGSFFGEDTTKIIEIKNWVAGIDIALEFNDANLEIEKINEIITLVVPNFIQVPLTDYIKFKTATTLPIIAVTDNFSAQIEVNQSDYVLYTGLIEENKQQIKDFCLKNRTFISCKSEDYSTILNLLTFISPYGIELQGENEISPGLKTFDEFAEVLEMLENND